MYSIHYMYVAKNQSTLQDLDLVVKGYLDGIGALTMEIKGNIILHSYENYKLCYELVNLAFSNLKICSRKNISDLEYNEINKSINEMLKHGLPIDIKNYFENNLMSSIKLEYNI